jgi:uncharacterized membrane protein
MLSNMNGHEVQSAPTEDESIPGIGRLLALTDGVVAIALTLLVLQLQVPATAVLKSHPHSAKALWHSLNVDRDELISYLVAFLVIAQYWLIHHRMMRTMDGHHEGLAWRNFGFLLALTLMPFTSDLLGRYGQNPVAITLFGLNLAALTLSIQWIFRYGVKHKLMRGEGRSAHEELQAQVRALLLFAVVALAIVTAWTVPSVSNYFWLIFLFTPFLGERITTRIEQRRLLDPKHNAAE